MFLEWLSVGISPPTLKTYALTLRALFPEISSPDFDQWMRSLVTQYGANKPSKQATPLSPTDFKFLFSHLPSHLKWPFFLAWKTVSRWADVSVLTKEDFQLVEPSVILVNFSDKTKASHDRPFRPDMLVLVEDPLVPHFWEYLQTLTGTLSQVNTTTLTKEMQRITQHRYTGQSIKRGALNFLTMQAAQGHLPGSVIPLMAKHAHSWLLPENTSRYITDKTSLAKLMGTQSATRLLPSVEMT
jgi:hypothetical protein